MDVSDSGLLGLFDRPLSISRAGQLTVPLAGDQANIKVRVVRVNGRHAGLSFQIGNESDRAAIHRLVDFASKHQGLSPAVTARFNMEPA